MKLWIEWNVTTIYAYLHILWHNIIICLSNYPVKAGKKPHECIQYLLYEISSQV